MSEVKNEIKVNSSQNINTIYADTVLQVQFNEAITKITFGVEIDDNEFNKSTTLSIPTKSFIESISFFNELLKDGTDVHTKLCAGSSGLVEALNKLNK